MFRARIWLTSSYRHAWADGSVMRVPAASKIVCIAKNYHDGANARSTVESAMKSALIFLKPPSALVDMRLPIPTAGRSDTVCETEIALLITQPIRCLRESPGVPPRECRAAIGGMALAFDLTLRDLQNSLKEGGKPWELAKAFDGACPISSFLPIDHAEDSRRRVELRVDGELVLSQSTEDMLIPFDQILSLISRHMSLQPGDVVLTGTPLLPQPPPRLRPGSSLEARLDAFAVQTIVGN